MIRPVTVNRVPHVLWIVLLIGLAGFLCVSCDDQTGNDAPSGTEEPVNPQRLVGQWVREDGGYILEIGRVRSNGRIEARYFNPRPINVGTAELRQEKKSIGVFIELRDRGYPGSYYELTYKKSDDALIGSYFQATQQIFYEVEFVRRPTQ